jgi:hypothetical protein
MRWSLGCVVIGTAACSFDGHPVNGDGGVVDAPGPTVDMDPFAPDAPDAQRADAMPGDRVAHLSPAVEAMLTNTNDVVTTTARTIDTTAGTVSPPFGTAALILADVPQDNGGPNVMVIQARTFTFGSGLYLVGDKPLIIVATETLVMDAQPGQTGIIDADATNTETGPGGYPGTLGPGAGGSGSGGDNDSDSGGAGGGHGSMGGPGGAVAGDPGGTAGVISGTATVLQGGSGGGNGSPQACDGLGGPGGGAIQLTAYLSIDLTDTDITAAGGGGGRGEACSSDGGAAGGGGAGGMIYLQAPSISGNGRLSAHGGGGGAAASQQGGQLGMAGSAGNLFAGGSGGGTISTTGGDGGNGGDGTASGDPGESMLGTSENGGGGGGGVGRIYYHTVGALPGFDASPPAVSL